jgi:hypothetical protein
MADGTTYTKPAEWDAMFIIGQSNLVLPRSFDLPGAGSGATFSFAPGGRPGNVGLTLSATGTVWLP